MYILKGCELMEKVRNKIKYLRKMRHLTLDDLSNKTNINRATLNNYENGKTEPKQETWELLSKFFNVSVAYLMGITQEPTKNISYKEINDASIRRKNEEYLAIGELSEKFRKAEAFMQDLQSEKDFDTMYLLMGMFEMAEKAKGWTYDQKDNKK